MSRGPLPNPQRRRRNAPTIQNTVLPAAGRSGPAPDAPAAYRLGKAGLEWWSWAWRTPQATRWGDGALYAVARRAQLEDELGKDGSVSVMREMRELDKRLGLDPKALAELRWVIGEAEPSGSADAAPVVRRLRAVDAA